MLQAQALHGNIDYLAARQGCQKELVLPSDAEDVPATWQKTNLQRILYIEDDEDIAAIGCMILEGVGNFDVRHFNSGEAAINAYDAVAPDLIIVDVMMPGLDGPATIMHLMNIHAEKCAPFIFMTARAQLHEQEEYRALGALDVIVKPFDPMTLCDEIQTIWDKHHTP
ncbi:response regulator [Rhodobacteraceae bacterium KMM 6894]|nr:response regulator [Rhodobacteraceae bacterium KMM 6894]